MDDPTELARYLDASAWAGIGLIGVLLFVLGIYQPALSGLPYAAYLRIVVAIAGGAVAVMGLSFWYRPARVPSDGTPAAPPPDPAPARSRSHPASRSTTPRPLSSRPRSSRASSRTRTAEWRAP